MAGVNVTSIRNRFNSEIEKSFTLIRVIANIKPKLHQKYVFLVVELSFLKVYIAWEQFLEDTFVNYIMGRKTRKGYKVKSFVNPKNFIHAKGIINEGRNYSKWDYDEVIRKSLLFLKNGYPYKNTLQPISNYLKEMSYIRNSIVHGSSHSMERFKSIVRSKIKYAPAKITPGEFLLKIESKTKKTFFQHYTDFVVDASKKIVP